MVSVNYSKTLLNNAQANTSTFGIPSKLLFLREDTAYYKPYFFLDKELDLYNKPEYSFIREKLAGNIRHCKILHGSKTFYDYIVHKEFNSLEEWAADCGSTISNVLYGINRPYESYIHYTTIHSLINKFTADKLVFNTPEQKKETIETILAREGLTADDLWIQTCGNHMVSWRNFVKTC